MMTQKRIKFTVATVVHFRIYQQLSLNSQKKQKCAKEKISCNFFFACACLHAVVHWSYYINKKCFESEKTLSFNLVVLIAFFVIYSINAWALWWRKMFIKKVHFKFVANMYVCWSNIKISSLKSVSILI